MRKVKIRFPILTKILTNLVFATAIGTTILVLMMTFAGSLIQVLWSDATIILGLFIMLPVYMTIFAIVTWTIILYNK